MTKETEKNALNRIMAELTAIDELIAETELKAADYIKLISAAAGSNDDVIKAVTALFEDPARLQAAHEAPADLASAFIDRHGGIEAFKNELNTQREEYTGKMQQAAAALDSITNAVKEITESESYKRMVSAWTSLNEYYEAHKDEQYPFLANRPADLQELAPFIEEEIKAREIVEPGEEALYAQDVILDSFTIDGQPIEDAPFRQIIDGALARKAEYEKGAALVANIEHIIARPIDALHLPLDKPTVDLFSYKVRPKQDGQLKWIDVPAYTTNGVTLKTFDEFILSDTTKGGKSNKTQERAFVLYGLNFQEDPNITITNNLNEFDELVYIAIDALMRAGNKYISSNQICKLINGGRKANNNDKKKIENSIDKMGYIRVYINNKWEAQRYSYPEIEIDEPLIAFRRITARINGAIGSCIEPLTKDLPVMRFTRSRDQFMTFDSILLAAPVNKTKRALKIQKYLLEHIGRMKGKESHKVPRKMAYKTLFERCEIKNYQAQADSKATIKIFLEHYKENDYIKGYIADQDGIEILL